MAIKHKLTVLLSEKKLEYRGYTATWKDAPLTEIHQRYTILNPSGGFCTVLDLLGHANGAHWEEVSHQIDRLIDGNDAPIYSRKKTGDTHEIVHN